VGRGLGAEPGFGNASDFAGGIRAEEVFPDGLVKQYSLK
jgi:hypothetical protein